MKSNIWFRWIFQCRIQRWACLFDILYGCRDNLEKLRKTRNKNGFTHKKNSIFNWKSFIFQSSMCHFLRFLMLKKCKKNLGFRLSSFERYMAEKLSLSIELPVWRVTRTWSESLYCVFEISILYHWLLAFVEKWCNVKRAGIRKTWTETSAHPFS